MERPVFTDTHAHLDDAKFSEDLADVLSRAQEAGVETMITVGCWDAQSGFDGVSALLRGHANLYAALGVHPHDAKDAAGEGPFELIREMALSEEFRGRVVAVGEAGLDFHYDNSPREAQKRVFARQVALARELKLPLVVHTREADEPTFEILASEGARDAGGVFHCFSSSIATARRALDMGFHISFSGVVTFGKAHELRRVAEYVPTERMLIETDCPYLAPAPHRGERNEPAFVVEVARKIAGVKGLSLADVARITTRNSAGLFGLDAAPATEDARIAYVIRNSLYLNITNRCTNQCGFCAKFESYTVKGHYLRLAEEPDARAVMEAVGPEPGKYDEVVFCGFGEPLIRLDLVKEVGLRLKRMGCRIRIDTDGLANLVHGRNVLPELMFVDCISVSLNAPDPETYRRLTRTPFGDAAYPALLFFLREAKKHVSKVVATAVSVPGVDMEACRRVAEDELGVAFRVREYNVVG